MVNNRNKLLLFFLYFETRLSTSEHYKQTKVICVVLPSVNAKLESGLSYQYLSPVFISWNCLAIIQANVGPTLPSIPCSNKPPINKSISSGDLKLEALWVNWFEVKKNNLKTPVFSIYEKTFKERKLIDLNYCISFFFSLFSVLIIK